MKTEASGRFSIRAAALAAVVMVVALLGRPAWAGLSEAEADHDLWYVIEMAGQRTGWMHSTQRTEGDRIVSTTDMRLKIKRGPTTIEIRNSSEFVETREGEPVSMKCTQELGASPVTIEYTFGPEGVTTVTTQMGIPPVTATAPRPEGTWLTPAAAQTFTRKRLEAGAEEIVVRTIDPTLGLRPVVATRRVLERTTAEALGKTVPAIKCLVTQSAAPGMETIEFVDERGLPIRSVASVGGITLTTVLADRELAMAELDPPELMQRLFVRPSRPISGAREVRSAEYVLRVPGDGAALAGVPATGTQRVGEVEGDALRVTVEADEPVAAEEGDAEDEAYTAASSMINSDDVRVKELAARATSPLGEGADAAARAEAMRRFVHTYIRVKNLGVGFASASQVARTREGDCTEHAALLAAMLRADGIPSRTVSGVIYADAFEGSEQIFGYHMWTQALLTVDGRPRWIDLDATLGAETPFDATHIALAVSALGDDEPQNALVTLAPLLGRLEIEVVRTETAAEAVR